jgi:hypothetical protein
MRSRTEVADRCTCLSLKGPNGRDTDIRVFFWLPPGPDCAAWSFTSRGEAHAAWCAPQVTYSQNALPRVSTPGH